MQTKTTPQINLKALPTAVTIKGNNELRRVYLDGKTLPISHSRRLYDYSPQFGWGLKGTASSKQLALAILLYYLPSEIALRFHLHFEDKVISSWLFYQDFVVVLDIRNAVKKIINDLK